MKYSVEEKREFIAVIAEEHAEDWWSDLSDDARGYYFTSFIDYKPNKRIGNLSKEDKIKLFKIVFD